MDFLILMMKSESKQHDSGGDLKTKGLGYPIVLDGQIVTGETLSVRHLPRPLWFQYGQYGLKKKQA
jgi:hypothetical protein